MEAGRFALVLTCTRVVGKRKRELQKQVPTIAEGILRRNPLTRDRVALWKPCRELEKSYRPGKPLLGCTDTE